MSFEEKNTWVYVAVTELAYVAYLVIILGRAQSTPLTEVPYVGPMLWTIGAAMGAAILGHIAIVRVWPRDADEKDQREKAIDRHSERIGRSFLVIGAVAALILALAGADYFWIANALYWGCVLSALIGSAARLVAYRVGFQSWPSRPASELMNVRRRDR